MGCGSNNRPIVEKIGIERSVGFAESSLDDRCSKSTRVNEQLGFEATPVISNEASHIAVFMEIHGFHFRFYVPNSPLRAQLSEERTDEMRIEVIAIAQDKRKVGWRDWCKSISSDPRWNEEGVRMCADVAAGSHEARRMEEFAQSEMIKLRWERVKITLKSGA
jgi:hypothetical protein